jgi:hypothetical protein
MTDNDDEEIMMMAPAIMMMTGWIRGMRMVRVL